MSYFEETSIRGMVDDNNSYDGSVSGYLGVGGVFTGTATEILDCGIIFVSSYSDQASAADGLCLQQSVDGTNWDYCDAYTLDAGEAKNYSLNPHAKYYRVTYTNGAVTQTAFRLQSICKGGNCKPSSHRIKDEIIGDDDCELIKAALTGINGEDKWHNARVNGSGILLTSNFLAEVQLGNVPGYSAINKFGHNGVVATTGEDIWSAGGTYGFYPTTAQSMEVVSTAANDNSGGTGARTVQVFGLDSNWEEVTETKSLTGIAPVALSNTYVRIYRMIVLTAGSLGTNAGIVTAQISGGGTVGAHVAIGDGQTQQAIYTIPSDKVGLFVKGYVALANPDKGGEDGTFQWLSRSNTIADGAWQIKGQMSLVNIGSSHWQYEYGIPNGPIPGKTDLRLRMSSASDVMDTVGGFDLILVDV